MTRKTIVVGFLTLLLAVLGSGAVAADSSPSSKIEYAGHYIVGYSGYAMSEEAEDYIGDAGGEISEEWEDIAYMVVRGISEEEAENLRDIAGVTSVTRDVILQWIPEPAEVEVRGLVAPELESHPPSGAVFFDTFQWNMRQIDADDAWAAGFEARPEVLVAILDTGINTNHFDMADLSFIPGFTPIVDMGLSRNVLSFTTGPCLSGGETLDPSNFDDYNFHGTHVGGIVNTNGIGTAGVAPHATLVAVKVLNCQGLGTFGDLINGILYAASIPVDVINMSLGADVPNIPANAPLLNALTSAIEVALDAGVYVVASAGNEAPPGAGRELPEVEGEGELLHVPAQSHEDVAAISATGPFNQMNFDHLASYSNFGEEVISVAAPGGDFVSGNPLDFVLSPCSPSSVIVPLILGFSCGPLDYIIVVGTSQAAPHVSGAGAMIDAQFGGALDGEKIKDIIEGTADEEVVPDVGDTEPVEDGRRLNVFNALTADDGDDDDDDDDGDDDDDDDDGDDDDDDDD